MLSIVFSSEPFLRIPGTNSLRYRHRQPLTLCFWSHHSQSHLTSWQGLAGPPCCMLSTGLSTLSPTPVPGHLLFAWVSNETLHSWRTELWFPHPLWFLVDPSHSWS
jgi:hypothetical protein